MQKSPALAGLFAWPEKEEKTVSDTIKEPFSKGSFCMQSYVPIRQLPLPTV